MHGLYATKTLFCDGLMSNAVCCGSVSTRPAEKTHSNIWQYKIIDRWVFQILLTNNLWYFDATFTVAWLFEMHSECYDYIEATSGLKKKIHEIPITLPTLNYLAILFYIFIFMQIYANLHLNMLIYAHFSANFSAHFLIKLKNLTKCQRKCLTEMQN